MVEARFIKRFPGELFFCRAPLSRYIYVGVFLTLRCLVSTKKLHKKFQETALFKDQHW